MNATPATSLANHLLVALPSLDDPNFARSVVLLCQHDAGGAMGIVVNRASEYCLGEVLSQVGLHGGDESLRGQPVLGGGPVHPERGFVLHDGAREWESSLAIADSLRVTTSRDVLEAMAEGEGPRQAVVALPQFLRRRRLDHQLDLAAKIAPGGGEAAVFGAGLGADRVHVGQADAKLRPGKNE